MACIDYGAVVLKDGKQINHDLFEDMLDAVGWIDEPRRRYDDCWLVDENGRSMCDECIKRTVKHFSHPELGEWDATVGDCRGMRITASNCIDGNYYAYIGDKELTLCFHKNRVAVVDNSRVVMTFGDMWDYDTTGRMSIRECVGSSKTLIHLKRIADGVWHLSTKYKGSRYDVIFGLGIDPDPLTWVRCRSVYYNKKDARKLERFFVRYWMRDLFKKR